MKACKDETLSRRPPEDMLDEALEETFPASDPLAIVLPPAKRSQADFAGKR